MPIIPRLPTPGPLDAAPAPVLDRERRPTVDSSREIAAVGALGKAGQMPLDDNDYTLRGMGAAGAAVMRAGSIMGALAVKKQEATDSRMLNMARSGMDQVAIDFGTWQAANQNNPEAWAEEARKRADGVINPFLEMKELSKSAKADLALMGKSWTNRFIGTVDTQGTKAIFGLANKGYTQRAREAFDAGDTAKGVAALQEGRDAGFVGEDEFNALSYDGSENAKGVRREVAKKTADTYVINGNPEKAKEVLEASKDDFEPEVFDNEVAKVEVNAVRSKNYQDLLVTANDDPKLALRLAPGMEREGKIDSTMRVNVERAAQSNEAADRSVANREYSERIQTPGMMPTEAEITMDKRLNYYDRAMLMKKRSGTPINQQAEFEKVLPAITKFSPSNYATEDEAITAAVNIEASIDATFDGAWASTLKEELTKRRKGVSLESSVTDVGPAMAMINEEVEAGGLGQIKRPVLKDGKPLFRDPKEDIGFTQGPGWFGKKKVDENNGKPVAVMVDDPVADAKARAIQKEIRETVENEVKAGILKDQSAIMLKALDLYKLKGGKLRPAPAAPVTPAPGYQGGRFDVLPNVPAPTVDGAIPDRMSVEPAGPNPIIPDLNAWNGFIDKQK